MIALYIVLYVVMMVICGAILTVEQKQDPNDTNDVACNIMLGIGWPLFLVGLIVYGIFAALAHFGKKLANFFYGFIKVFTKDRNGKTNGNRDCTNCNIAIEALMQPKIIYCDDCKEYIEMPTGEIWTYEYFKRTMMASDYCSYAEKKEED